MSVTEIQISKEKLEELNSLLKTGIKRNVILRQFCGGSCGTCGDIPTKKVSIDISDPDLKASRIEFYCDKCFTLLTATNGIDKTIVTRDKKSHGGA